MGDPIPPLAVLENAPYGVSIRKPVYIAISGWCLADKQFQVRGVTIEWDNPSLKGVLSKDSGQPTLNKHLLQNVLEKKQGQLMS